MKIRALTCWMLAAPRLPAIALLVVMLFGGMACANAQNYPTRAIRLLAPTAAGGAIDLVARVVGERLTPALGQQVVVDNRPGGQGIAGSDIVAKATADGYTLLISNDNLTVFPYLSRQLPFDPRGDFAPILLMTKQPFVVTVHASLPASTFKEFVDLVKSKPGVITTATAGAAQYLTSELMRQAAGLRMVHVPYNGSRAMVDLAGGQVQSAVLGASTVRPHARAGRVRILAVTTSTRSPALPDVPTLAELGLTGFDVFQWIALFAPAKTPSEIIARLNSETTKVMQQPLVRERLDAAGFETRSGAPKEVEALVRDGIARWGKLIKEAGLKLSD